jgi:hypothetical protein
MTTADEDRVLALYQDRFGSPCAREIARAELEVVERFAGPEMAVETFVHATGHAARVLAVTRPISAIGTVLERRTLDDDPAELVADADYWQLDGFRLCRVAATWGAYVQIEYTAAVDAALRDRVTVELMKLSASFRTYERMQVGAAINMTAVDHAARRQQLLAELTEGRAVLL